MTLTNQQKDSKRSVEAVKAILDNRHPIEDFAEIMVTLEHMVALCLLVLMNQDGRLQE